MSVTRSSESNPETATISRGGRSTGPPADCSTRRSSARGWTAGPLLRTGTQTVFGEGPADARVVLVGEHPGDREDLEGRPFVGPAGRLLDEALEEAGIDRGAAYVTNAVKHFKWQARGKRRIHQKDRKSTRLNSSHANISYAVFCLKKKKRVNSDISGIGQL